MTVVESPGKEGVTVYWRIDQGDEGGARGVPGEDHGVREKSKTGLVQ